MVELFCGGCAVRGGVHAYLGPHRSIDTIPWHHGTCAGGRRSVDEAGSGPFPTDPLATACYQGHRCDPSDGGAGEGSLFRSETVTEPQYQLQHLSSDWARWRGHVARVDRAQMAEGWAQRTHGAERRFQRGAVLGWA